jgi:hypothetical protein
MINHLKRYLLFLKIYTFFIFIISGIVFLVVFPYLLSYSESIILSIALFDFSYLNLNEFNFDNFYGILGAIILILVYIHLLATKILDIHEMVISSVFTYTPKNKIRIIQKLITYLLITFPLTTIIVIGSYFFILDLILKIEGLNLTDIYIVYKNSPEIIELYKKIQINTGIILTLIITFLGIININKKKWITNFKKIVFTKENLQKIFNLSDISEIEYSFEDYLKKNVKGEVTRLINDLILLNSDKVELAITYINKGYTKDIIHKTGNKIFIKNNELSIEIIELELISEYEKYIRKDISWGRTYSKDRKVVIKISNFKGIVAASDTSNLFSIPVKDIIIIFKTGFSIYNIHKYSQYFGKYLLDFEITALKIDNNNNLHLLYNSNEKEVIAKFISVLSKIAEKFYRNKNYNKSFIVYYKGILYLFIFSEETISKSNKLISIPFYLLANSKKIEEIISNFKLQIKQIIN